MSTPWQLETSDGFTAVREWYEKKRPNELAAVINNLKRYSTQLIKAKNSLCVQGGYIHSEGRGVIALDESAGGSSLAATRLYVFPDDKRRVLHLITIGDKGSQQRDIKACHAYVDSIKE